MTLRARAFERALAGRVREELRVSPNLWEEHRRQRRRWRDRTLPGWASNLWAAGLLSYLLWSGLRESPGLELGLAVLAIWSLASVSGHGGRLVETLFHPAEVRVLYLLPLSDRQVFAVQGRKYFWRSLVFALWHLPAGLVLCGLGGTGGLTALALALVAVVHGLLVPAMAVHFAAWWPGGWHRHLGKFIWLAPLLLFGWRHVEEHLPAILRSCYWLAPFGWLNFAFYEGLMRGDGWALTLLLPVAFALWTVPVSWARLRIAYRLDEPQAEEERTAEAAAAASGSADALRPGAGPTEVLDHVRSGAFLRGMEWGRLGFMERVVGRWLTPRERVVAEFMLGGEPNWGTQWRRAAVMTGFALGVILLLGGYGSWIVFLAAYVVVAFATPLLGGAWAGFNACPTGAVFAPMYAIFPLGYREIARVLMKANLLRCVAAAPLLALVGAVAGYRLNGLWWAGMVIALKGLAVLLTAQPAIAALRFGAGTNDTQNLRLVWVLVLTPAILGLMGLGAGVFLAPDGRWTAASLAGFAMVSAGLLALYGVAWRRGWFDLLRTKAEEL